MKICSRCKLTKNPNDFHLDKTKVSGLASKCKECAIRASRAWYEANKGRVLADSRAAYAIDPTVKNQQAKRWREKNADRKRQIDKAWREANHETVRAAKMRRKVTKIQRRRPYDKEFFQLVEVEAHHLAAIRQDCTGVQWHVDHIVPLRSKIVSGFHNEFNLAVITARQNMIKGNRIWPDKP